MQKKILDEIQHPSLIKKIYTQQTRNISENFQCNKGHLWKTNITFNDERLSYLPLWSGTRQGVCSHHVFSILYLRFVSGQLRITNKWNALGQKERSNRMYLHMTWSSISTIIRNPLKTIRINEFNKVAGYKVNIKISCISIH